jgi:transmembrane sensor
MDRTNEIDSMASVTEQASAWWVLLNEADATATDRRAFAEWAKRSPECVGAYLQAAQLTQVLSSPGTKWPDMSVEELVRAAQASRHDVAWLGPATGEAARVAESTPRTSSKSFPSLAARLVALAAVVIATVATGFYFYARPERLETAIGEQRSVRLSDGSLVTLNTASTVELRFAGSRRQVTLLGGEALFKVAHDPKRPFDVIAGETTVRAIGTRFNVDRRQNATTVTVVEGRVAVFSSSATGGEAGNDRVLLSAGETVSRSTQRAGEVGSADVGRTIAWTERKLIFERRPLGEVAAEFNRYNRRIIEIRGDRLRSEEVTGVFQADDPDSFVAFLARLPGVRIESDGTRFVVESAVTEGEMR